MLCVKCKKNQATKTYQTVRKDKTVVEYYCLDCYHRLFSGGENAGNTEHTGLVCPYCGITAEEVKKRNLVGCAKCYTTLQDVLSPMVLKMQGKGTHKGKKPSGGASEKIARRCGELKIMIEKFHAERDFDSAREYTERLMMLQKGTEEEDYV